MQRNSRCSIWRIGIIAGGLAAIAAGPAIAAVTVSFQNGVNNYTGTFDRYISERLEGFEFDGSQLASYLIDGFGAAAGSPDEQGLIRFDNIFGNGPGQIPQGAFILDAHLQVVTGGWGSADTGGPYGVAGLLAPFDSNTSYFDSYPPLDPNDPFGGYGPWWTENHATRPVGGYGAMDHAQIGQARVAALVQQWSDGSLPNHGMVIQAGFVGTTDGWRFATTGYPAAQMRPKLTVTYTTDPIEVNTFQPGVDGYDGVTMVRMLSSLDAANEETIDGVSINQGFLDGADAATQEQLALIKFSDIFGPGAGQAPADAPVAKGWLVLTTGDESANARTRGPYDVHVMQRDWDTTSLYSDFGATPGLQVADGDISPAIDSQFGMITGGEAWFDVTSYLEGVRTGTPDHGLAILPGTTDGWQIFFNGAGDTSVRPQLVIASQLGVTPGAEGDFNNNGVVDAADYTVWRDGLSNTHTPDQYNTWRANFGATGPVAPPAPPETLVHYDFMGKATAAVPTAPASQVADGLTAADLSYGPGINPANLSNGFSANGWDRDEPSREDSLATGAYFQFGVTVDPGHIASLETLDLALRRSAFNAPMNLELQASVDGFATDGMIISEFNYFGRTSGTAPEEDPLEDDPFFYMHTDLPGRPNSPTSVPGDPIPTIDLSVFSELQDLPAGSEVTFRLYAWGNTSTSSTNTLALGRGAGPLIGGTVIAAPGAGQALAAVPEPSSAMLIAMMGVALAIVGARRR